MNKSLLRVHLRVCGVEKAMDDLHEAVLDNLEERLRSASQRAVAKELGISPVHLNRLVVGKERATLKMAKILLESF